MAEIDLRFILERAFAGASFPTSVCLMLSLLEPRLLRLVSEVPVYLALAGLMSALLALATIFSLGGSARPR